jgi:chromosome segregation ATPase
MDGKQQPLEAKLDELAQKISVMDGTQQDALEQHVAHRQELVTHRQDLAHLQGELASGMEAAREESKGLVAQLAEVAALVAAKADRQDLAAKADSKDLAAKADRQDLAVMEGKLQEGQAKHDALAENFKEVWAEALPKIQVRQLTDQTFSWY